MDRTHQTNGARKQYVAIVGAGPVGLVCAAKLALSLGQDVNIEIYERRINWSAERGCYEWISEENGNRRREQVVTLQDDVVNLFTHEEVRRLFDGERVWRTSRNVAIRDLEDRLLDFLQREAASGSNVRVARLPEVLHDDNDRIDAKKYSIWVNSLDVDVVIGADGANSMTRSSFGIGHVALGSTDERLLKRTDFALGIGLTAEGVDGGQRQALNAALTLAQTRYLLNSEHGKRGYLNIRLTPGEYGLLLKQNSQGSCGFANPINLYNLYRETETDGDMPLVDGVPKIEEIISEGLNLFNLSWRHVNSIVGIQITPTYAEQFYRLEADNSSRPKHVLLVGDAAMSHHFWPGRGLNTGLKSAVAATAAVERFVQTGRNECFRRFDLFMTMLRFREMQGRSASMLRKDNSLPHWLDEIDNLPANHKPSEKSLTRVVLDQTSKNADSLRERFLDNVVAWNSFNEASTGWPHEMGAVPEETIRGLVYTSHTRPKPLTLRAMVDSAVSNNPRRAGWPIHQQRGIGKFTADVSPQGWWVGVDDAPVEEGGSLDDVKTSVLKLMCELSALDGSHIDMIATRLKQCGVDLGDGALPSLKYDLLMQEGMGILEKADYQLPTVFVLGNTNAGKSSAIASLRGDPLMPKYDKHEDRHYLVPGVGYAGPQIGMTDSSVTCLPVLYPITTPQGPINLCDTAGFFETRGALYEAVGISLGQYVLSAASNPTGFVVVCEMGDFHEVCGRTLKRTLDLLAQVFPDAQSQDKRACPAPDINILLMVSKTKPGYKPTSLRKLLESQVDAIGKAELRGEKHESRTKQYLQFLLDCGNLATYGTDNVMYFLPRGKDAEDSVGGSEDMMDMLGSWNAFASTRLGNLSTVCGGNARNFLGSLLLREATAMNDVMGKARGLLLEWESKDAQVRAHLPGLARQRHIIDAFTQGSLAVKRILSEGVALAENRKEKIHELKGRLEELNKDDEVVVWNHTELWNFGEKSSEKEITFTEDGFKIQNVKVDLSTHIAKVCSDLSADGSRYLGTFRNNKARSKGYCTVTLTSKRCDMPAVAQARRDIEGALALLGEMQTSWRARQDFLEHHLKETDAHIMEVKVAIVQQESEILNQQATLDELSDNLRGLRRDLSLSPKYESLLSLYHKLCDSEGLQTTFPSDMRGRIRAMRAAIDKQLESRAPV